MRERGVDEEPRAECGERPFRARRPQRHDGNRTATNGRNNLGLTPTAATQSRATTKSSAKTPAAKSPQNQGPVLEKDLVRQIKSLVAAQ